MKRFKSFEWGFIVVGLIIALAGLSRCSSKPEQKSSAPRAWTESMSELSRALAELLPMTAKPERFNEPNNRSRLVSLTNQMAQLAAEINRTTARPDVDPSLKYFTQLFEDDMVRAQQSLQMGQLDYARHVLRSTTSYCISCHSRSNDGPEFSSLQINKQISSLGPFEKAEFYAATRQFARASAEFEDVLKNASAAHLKPFDWEQSARFALALNVRVRQNPVAALHVVDSILKAKHAAKFIKQDATAWKKSVVDWIKEPHSALNTSSERLAEAKRLLSKAKTRQKYPLDRSGDVEYMRASAILHDILRSPLDDQPKNYEQALYYAGVAAEAVRDLSLWNLHETYYEICIRYSAHSPQAMQCFERLQESILAGYSGSRGTSVPSDVQHRLDQLKQLAQDR